MFLRPLSHFTKSVVPGPQFERLCITALHLPNKGTIWSAHAVKHPMKFFIYIYIYIYICNIRGSYPGEGEISRTCPHRSWDPPSLLDPFPGGIKRPGRGVDHPPSSTSSPPLRPFMVCYRVNVFLSFYV
jgi:hypothetical protein